MKKVIKKPREERYTFFKYTQGLGRSQTLFRGAKIQVVDLDDTQDSLEEIGDSQKYDDYKFAAIQRTIRYNFYKKESPLEIEIIKNEKFKTILMVITKRESDYRIQSGLNDYTYEYAKSDNIKNSNQQQFKFDSFTSSMSTFVPYGASAQTYTEQAVLRPRQMFMGGGYLQLGDPKLGGVVSTESPQPTFSSSRLTFAMAASSTGYPFVVSDEVNTSDGSYSLTIDSTYPYYYDTSLISTVPRSFSIEGRLDRFNSISQKYTIPLASPTGGGETSSPGPDVSNIYYPYTYENVRLAVGEDRITIEDVSFRSRSIYPYFRNLEKVPGIKNGIYTYQQTQTSTNTGTEYAENVTSELFYRVPTLAYPFTTLETFLIGGGNQFFNTTKNLLSFANIKNFINEDSAIISYYDVTDSGKTSSINYRLRFVSPDLIKKSGVLNYFIDNDRPPQYQDTGLIMAAVS